MIELKNVIKNFGKIAAVNNVSLSVQNGETLGLVGESGSGKSTLARLILKLIEPTGGTIDYGGISDLRKDCQIVFQDPQTSLNPRIRVGDAIAEPMLIRKIVDSRKSSVGRRVEGFLDMVKLPVEYANRYPHALSGGERQRVGIARALASEPKFLILDEPVSSLDVLIQVEMLKLLKELKQGLRLTYLFISHDLSVVQYMSDRVGVMKEGRLVELGTREQVLNNPKHEYTKRLLASTPKV